MAIGGSRLSPRLPPTPAPARPAAPVVNQATVNAPPPSKTKPAGQFQPTAAQPAAPVTTQTPVTTQSHTPAPAPAAPTKLNSSGTLTGSVTGSNTAPGMSAAGSHTGAPPAKYTYGAGSGDGLSINNSAQYGGKVNLGGAQTQANLNYKPTDNVQMGAQAGASVSSGTGAATAQGSFDAGSGKLEGKLSANVAGPQAQVNGNVTGQYGNNVSTKIEGSGTLSAGNAGASVSGNVNPYQGTLGVNAQGSAMGPNVSGTLGHTTQLGPFTFSNSVTGSVGTGGVSGGVNAGVNGDGVLSWGANAGMMAGIGGKFSHSGSFDPNWFKATPAPAPTASSQAQANYNQYVKPYDTATA